MEPRVMAGPPALCALPLRDFGDFFPCEPHVSLSGHHVSPLLLQPCRENLSAFTMPGLDVVTKPPRGSWIRPEPQLSAEVAFFSHEPPEFLMQTPSPPSIPPPSQARVSVVTQAQARAAAVLNQQASFKSGSLDGETPVSGS